MQDVCRGAGKGPKKRFRRGRYSYRCGRVWRLASYQIRNFKEHTGFTSEIYAEPTRTLHRILELGATMRVSGGAPIRRYAPNLFFTTVKSFGVSIMSPCPLCPVHALIYRHRGYSQISPCIPKLGTLLREVEFSSSVLVSLCLVSHFVNLLAS